jgi:hypothetical protein
MIGPRLVVIGAADALTRLGPRAGIKAMGVPAR